MNSHSRVYCSGVAAGLGAGVPLGTERTVGEGLGGGGGSSAGVDFGGGGSVD